MAWRRAAARPSQQLHIISLQQSHDKATSSGITVSGLGLSLLSRRAGGSTHYAIIYHSNLKVI